MPAPEASSSSGPMTVDPLYAPPAHESFQDRRRRFDQQETIWTRKKARTDDGDVDLNLNSFDFSKSTPLPSGWHYDEKTHEFTLGKTADWWSYEDGFLVRNHVWGRKSTYKPETFPIDPSYLQTTTGLTLQQGSRTIYVNSKEQQHFSEAWTGKTLYPLTVSGAEKTGLYYIGDLSDKLSRCKTLRGRGHIWQAVGAASPKKKNVKESADLNEKKMSLEDRLAFLEGKKNELSSIFENGVWEIELDPQSVDHNRVMRARFVLKWAADGKGGLKAKARLVLQGFADPDLLQGQLDTSSPTLSRSSRQVIIAISEVLSWERWTADVATAFLQGDPQQRILWARIPEDACELIGVPPGTLMRLIKPLYGQADAPRQWFAVARRRLLQLGFQSHPLDQCLYMFFDENKALTAMVGIHVDDLFGCGLASSPTYQQLTDSLKTSFNFKHWTKEGERPLEFCGCQLARTATESVMTQADYLKGIKPMTCADNDPERDLNSREQSSLRALLGALQWPATQTSPHLCALVSLLCGEVTPSTVGVAQQANKTLRFAKNNNDAGLIFRSLGGSLDNLCMVAMSDAAWGVRRNNESQGGYLVLLCNKAVLDDTSDHDYIILDWRSFKLPRVSRSSLNAESQACSAAMDALEYLLIFWEGCLKHDFQLRQVNELKPSLSSALVVDAKALYDSLKAETPSLQGDKRTKIEVMVTKQKMLCVDTKLRWVSSEIQLADGVTKSSARQLFADRLRSHQISLRSDMTFQAAKKKTLAERQANARKHAISRSGNRHSLAYMILTSQMMMVQAMQPSFEMALDFAFSPEMTLILFILLMTMVGWHMWGRATTTTPMTLKTMTTTETWTMTTEGPSSSAKECGTQAETALEKNVFGLLKMEITRLQQDLRDSDAYNAQLKDQLDALEGENNELEKEVDDLTLMRDYLSGDIGELDGKYKDVRIKWQTAYDKLEAIKYELDRNPVPRSVWTTRTGSKYHIYPDCQGLSGADAGTMRQYDYCAFCAQQEMMKWREF